jgi:hypothetical protein
MELSVFYEYFQFDDEESVVAASIVGGLFPQRQYFDFDHLTKFVVYLLFDSTIVNIACVDCKFVVAKNIVFAVAIVDLVSEECLPLD